MKYKYVPIFISYDKVADKMNHLAAQGYEFHKFNPFFVLKINIL